MAAPTPLDALTEAVQTFVNETSDDGPALLRGWVVSLESMNVDEDGDSGYLTRYVIGPSNTMAETVGLLALSQRQVMSDILREDNES